MIACFLLIQPLASDAATVVTSDTRVALVIGISKYQFAPPLANPGNDARRMAEALRRLNFTVDESYDPDYRGLGRALREFGLKAQSADVALIFFAGHGMQVDHENYLVPADAKLEREHDLLYEALSLDLPLGEVSQAKKIGILLLDACRNNPFVDRMTRSVSMAGRSVDKPKGLARVDRVPRNTIVVMATRADEITDDGTGEDSPFTQALLAHLQIPGLELSLFFRSVRDTVLRATNYRQEPYVFSSLGADPFYFYPRPPHRPPIIGSIAELSVPDVAGPTPLSVPRPTAPDDDPLTIRILSLPQSGEIRIDGKVVAQNDAVTLEKFATATFKPDPKVTGPVGTFDFLVDDGRGGTVVGSLPIRVIPTRRPPVVEPERILSIYPAALGIRPPVAPDGGALTVTITGLPSRGVVRKGATVLKTGDRMQPGDLEILTYTPEPGTVGDAGVLRYVADDGRGGTTEGRLQIRVATADESIGATSEAALWRRVRDEGDRDAIEAYLKLFPDSRFADAARQRIEVAAAPQATAPAPKPATAPPPAPAAKPVQTATAPAPAASPEPTARAADARRMPADNQVAAAPSPPPKPEHGQTTFQECPTCPGMVQIPAGSFSMGQVSGDPSAAPVHHVVLRAFALAVHPVTVAEWKACVAANGCSSVPRMVDATDQTPVHNISWDDAQEYVVWLSQKTGHRYRLPTEAEWEYAARANTTTRYWWGNEAGVGLANCEDCGGTQERSTPLPVGSFKPNPFGLFDVSGGVAEWVADCWYPTYQGAPTDGSAREQKNCRTRVLRGGSFRSGHNDVTPTARGQYDASVRYIANGLRVAAEVE
ncbi:SUMF1/EgtB/PvdO family nonheme iron enzyme [Aliidongia dinghuensis]|uniref:SUMF1/EgtB/PvdO family nonheme iron enzyme n=1 Tax=Aliidongia dinghuensis TaxID=1867774 RepID=UPI0016682734|nr:SUMF1/EgtB/PvdO family nonheme iron enzyme [Aliidongia dinghuensis]